MAKKAYYGVVDGKSGNGIYLTWDECEREVKGVSGAKYKKFKTEKEADEFVNSGGQAANTTAKDEKADKPDIKSDTKPDIKPGHIDVYVDGSYNSDSNTYGYGVYMDDGKNQRIICGKGTCRYDGRNIEGEVAAARAALSEISKSGKYNSVTLYHDYQGIGSWADGDWKTNKIYTQSYRKFVNDIRSQGLDIDFRHVDGHSGVRGNEYCDKLAKVACGMELTRSDIEYVRDLYDVPGYPKSDECIIDNDAQHKDDTESSDDYEDPMGYAWFDESEYW